MTVTFGMADNPWQGEAGVDVGSAHHVLALASSLELLDEEVWEAGSLQINHLSYD